jgi:hypothetical protein
MPTEFSCFKSKSNAAIQEEEESNCPKEKPSPRKQSISAISTASILKKFISFESVLSSCKKSSQSKNNGDKKRSFNHFSFSKTNETFNNDDEQPPTLSTASRSSGSSSKILSKKTSPLSANHVSQIAEEEFSDEAFRKILVNPRLIFSRYFFESQSLNF